MYLKTLTLRGFKSFASATSLQFEPGITCVVGPNGSGKSNIVDAFAWVMGEQGAKTLRGGKMDDVVFAGTAKRPPLGRAEVTLTIDNSDGALPIDYTEVTISRLLFRSGQSEYAINGNHCRLLDIAELLSDSGLGREMHVIVSQGQLDEVLHAGPEARRALIEEAAGVLKHRRRKEKALRKLEAMQANLTRLVDLTGELRRRLGPLGRQAAIARRAGVIQADLRDARLRLLADDYAQAAREQRRGEVDEAAVLARRAELEQALTQARAQEAALDADEQERAPRLASAQETWFALSSLGERLHGVRSLAAERLSHLAAEAAAVRPGRDPAELDLEAATLRGQETALGERLEALETRLEEQTRQREEAEAALAAAERALAAQVRAATERAEQLARLRGQVGAARSRVGACNEEAARLADAFEAASSRATDAQEAYEDYQQQASSRQGDRAGLAGEHEHAAAALAQCSTVVTERRAAERRASAERAAMLARTQALGEGIRALQGGDASKALLADPQWSAHVLGSVADLLKVADGAQEAVTAALGAAADAVAVASLDAAVRILQHARDEGQAGALALVIGNDHHSATDLAAWPELPSGVVPALDLVGGPDQLTGTLAGLLADVLVADSLAQAHSLVRQHPQWRVVTRDGDLVGTHWAQGRPAGPPSMLAMRAAADDAAAALDGAQRACDEAADGLAAALADEKLARQATDRALAALQAADRAAADVSGRLGQLAGAARAAKDEAGRLAVAISSAQEQRERTETALAELTTRLADAEGEEPSLEAAADAGAAGPGAEPESDRDALAARAAAARDAQTEARLEVATASERLRSIAGRADSLAAAAANERRAAQAAAARQRLRDQQATVAQAVATGADRALQALTASLAVATAEREAAEQARLGSAQALKDVRAQVRTLATELDTVVNSAHGAEIARAQRQMRIEQMAARALEEFGVEVGPLLAEYGPDVSVPVLDAEGGADGATVAYIRAEQEQRAATAQRQLDKLGKVNPLALEEYAALEERHTFLAAQLEDLKKTRRDLLTVVKEVDDRVQQVFASAFADTAAEFEQIFARLFPGGEGRLVLTEPDDMLATGIDVEARPPGKKVKRLSLLSGGERSLTAIAYLLAIFKARPSPFYVLDEVEAALDDTNLQRLLRVFEELRDISQLIVVTHQKRTMEVADALYGISMQGDGVSTVVSQRLRERERA
ncbi:MAG TPA: chromosome segregation protein SMC [Streptosporangiaceae bacterium]|nr:chromosome segregation protein SMC [Streptosporangiaceae bacterium]